MIIKPQIIRDTGDYLVRFHYLDIENGELVDKIVERYVNAGDTAVAPGIPTSLSAITKKSCALTFTSWNHTDLTNIQRDLDVGAIYDTADGKTHAFITVTATTGLELPIYFNKSDGSTLTIVWGDDSADYTTTSSGNVNTTHTYSVEGTYEITMWISSGTGVYSFGNDSSSTTFFGGSSQSYRNTLNRMFLGSNITQILSHSFYYHHNLNLFTLGSNITNIKNNSFQFTNINCISLSNSTTSLGNSVFSLCYCLNFISLSDSISSFGTGMFASCKALNSISLSELTINSGNLGSGNAIKKVSISNNITSLKSYMFEESSILVEINVPTNLITIEDGCFYNCISLKEFNIPSIVNSIGNSSFYGCRSLLSVNIPNLVTIIKSNTFYYNDSLKTITLNRFTAPSTITTLENINAFSFVNEQFRIYVPVGSLSVYQNATNWSSYANRMYEDTPENRAIFGD